jgi:hypothetical protein
MSEEKTKRSESVEGSTFISTWQKAGTLQEVAEKLGMREGSASQRACNMRKLGIRLKHMPKTTPVDLADLQALADELA